MGQVTIHAPKAVSCGHCNRYEGKRMTSREAFDLFCECEDEDCMARAVRDDDSMISGFEKVM